MRALATDPYTVLKHNRITSDNSPLSSVKNLPSTLQVKRETILRSPQTLTHICRIPSDPAPSPAWINRKRGAPHPPHLLPFPAFGVRLTGYGNPLYSFESTREDKTCRLAQGTCTNMYYTDQPLQDHTKLNLLKME